jgi:hypothetical protein
MIRNKILVSFAFREMILNGLLPVFYSVKTQFCLLWFVMNCNKIPNPFLFFEMIRIIISPVCCFVETDEILDETGFRFDLSHLARDIYF